MADIHERSPDSIGAGAPGEEIDVTPEMVEASYRTSFGVVSQNFPRAEAIWVLARRLHWKMEHLDPSENRDWDELSERKRDFFRLCVIAILDDADSVKRALE
jgi:hypothetical protein